jgi:hypothetical protein
MVLHSCGQTPHNFHHVLRIGTFPVGCFEEAPGHHAVAVHNESGGNGQFVPMADPVVLLEVEAEVLLMPL